jgi:hypothetical protein
LQNNVVDFPVDDAVITSRQASERLAIWLRLGIFAFVGVIIIPLFILGGHLKIPDIQCSNVIVGYTPNMMTLLGAGGSSPIYEPRYQIVIRDLAIPLPAGLTKIFVKGSRCGGS